jgi:RNase P subunit RPR2
MENARINELNKQIKDLEKEKTEIQQECSHKLTKVKFLEGTNTMRLFCKECDSLLGFPNQQEIDEFLNIKKDNGLQ